MSIRSDLLGVLNGSTSKKLPWFGDLSYYYQSLQRRGLLEKKHEGPEGEKRFYMDMGVGIYLYAPNVYRVNYGQEVNYSEVTNQDRIVARFETPIGTIESVQQYNRQAFCYDYVKRCVDTIEDLRIMRYVYEKTRYFENYEEYLSRERLWGEEGIGFALGEACMAPVQKLLSRWAGIEQTVFLAQEHPEEFRDIVHSIEQSQDDMVRVLAGSPAQIVALPENLSSDVTGEFLFREFNMPYYVHISTMLHATNKKVAIHIDGRLRPCLGMLSACGMDIAEAVTPAPFGDIAIEGLRGIAGKELILWGGLPGGVFSPVCSDETFEEIVTKAIRCADSKFVLGVADQVPPDAIPWRIRRVRELVDASPRL